MSTPGRQGSRSARESGTRAVHMLSPAAAEAGSAEARPATASNSSLALSRHVTSTPLVRRAWTSRPGTGGYRPGPSRAVALGDVFSGDRRPWRIEGLLDRAEERERVALRSKRWESRTGGSLPFGERNPAGLSNREFRVPSRAGAVRRPPAYRPPTTLKKGLAGADPAIPVKLTRWGFPDSRVPLS
jgi:hypothetical protein